MIKRLINRLFGKLQYKVTIINCDASGNGIYYFDKISEVDTFVTDVNSNKYDNIFSIEKIRVFDFVYRKNVIHKPLWFSSDDMTEKHQITENESYSYLLVHKSLSNVEKTK